MDQMPGSSRSSNSNGMYIRSQSNKDEQDTNKSYYSSSEMSESSDSDSYFPLQLPEPDTSSPQIQFNKQKLDQLCTFCSEWFATEKDLSIHLDNCNQHIKKILRRKCRQCLICNRRMPQFSFCGLIRHVNLCLIQQKESILNQSEPASSKLNVKSPQHQKNSSTVVNSDIEDTNVQNLDKSSSDLSERGQAKTSKDYFKPASFDSKVLEILEGHFKQNPHPTMTESFEIGKQIGVRIRKIQNWYAKKRREWQPHNAESWFGVGPKMQRTRAKFSIQYNNVKISNGNRACTTKEDSSKLMEIRQVRIVPKICPCKKCQKDRNKILIKCFEHSRYPDSKQRKSLCKETGMTGPQLSRWFYYRRIRRPKNCICENIRRQNEMPQLRPISPTGTIINNRYNSYSSREQVQES